MKRLLFAAAAVLLSYGAANAHAHKAQPAPVHQIPAAGVLNSEDLIALAKLGEVGAKDEFTSPPENAYLKRDFSLSIPVTAQGGIVGWYYDLSRQTLKINFGGSDIENGYGEFEIKLTSQTKDLGSYVGENAFGATAAVDSFHDDDFGLTLIGLPLSNDTSAVGEDYEVSISATPDEARQIATHIEVVVEGVVMADADSGVVACENRGSPATFDNPISLSVRSCAVNGAATKIVIRNTVTGAIYGQWLADPAHPYESHTERHARLAAS